MIGKVAWYKAGSNSIIAGRLALLRRASMGDDLGPNVPLRRKLWSISYPDVYARDRMYLWLHDRIDWWDGYGELAFRNGARALSEHLLQLRFADEAIERE